jgi:predicted ATP-dependent endonuclease of OLD family
MKIKKIIIKNFRAFDTVEIDFADFNCIIGKNDCGKSTVFAALDWFFSQI